MRAHPICSDDAAGPSVECSWMEPCPLRSLEANRGALEGASLSARVYAIDVPRRRIPPLPHINLLILHKNGDYRRS